MTIFGETVDSSVYHAFMIFFLSIQYCKFVVFPAWVFRMRVWFQFRQFLFIVFLLVLVCKTLVLVCKTVTYFTRFRLLLHCKYKPYYKTKNLNEYRQIEKESKLFLVHSDRL